MQYERFGNPTNENKKIFNDQSTAQASAVATKTRILNVIKKKETKMKDPY